jgi:flagellar hook assembly protein FlgD
MDRLFVLNNTLGFLKVSKTRMAVNAQTGGRVLLSVRLARDARLSFAVLNRDGRVVRQLVSGDLTPGTYGVAWDGRKDSGRAVSPGRYTIRAQARNELGRVTLKRSLLVLAET